MGWRRSIWGEAPVVGLPPAWAKSCEFTVRRVIRASIGNRAKEDLVVEFINQTARRLGSHVGLCDPHPAA